MPPTNPQVGPQPTPNSSCIPHKQQARLDDNGEPAGVPAAKKVKSTEQIGQKKKVPHKTRPEKTNPAASVSAAPAKKNLSVKIGILASDSDDSDKNNKNNTNSQFEESVVVDSSDEVEVIEEPAKDDEAQLDAYLTLLSNK